MLFLNVNRLCPAHLNLSPCTRVVSLYHQNGLLLSRNTILANISFLRNNSTKSVTLNRTMLRDHHIHALKCIYVLIGLPLCLYLSASASTFHEYVWQMHHKWCQCKPGKSHSARQEWTHTSLHTIRNCRTHTQISAIDPSASDLRCTLHIYLFIVVHCFCENGLILRGRRRTKSHKIS